MTDQKLDQAALNALVNDCYPDGWPWQDNDIWESPNGIYHLVYYSGHPPGTLKGGRGWQTVKYPLAGTWVIGSLIEKMGDRFYKLEFGATKWNLTVFIEPDDEVAVTRRFYGDTPIQALCAALRAVKKAQHE